MGVAAWGFGTGATGTGAHPFSLTVQGIDIIDWIDIGSIRLEASVGNSASLEFDVVEVAEAVPIEPFAYADIRFSDHGNAAAIAPAFQDSAFQDGFAEDATVDVGTSLPSVLFSGVLTSHEIGTTAVGRAIRVRCSDYGYLLDKCPLKHGVIVGKGAAWSASQVISSVIGQGAYQPRGGLSIVDGRMVGSLVQGFYYVPDDGGTGDTIATGNLRSSIDQVAERITMHVIRGVWRVEYFDVAAPYLVYVDPLERLRGHPADYTGYGVCPFEVGVDIADVKVEAAVVSCDYGEVAAGVFVSDTQPEIGADNSNFYTQDLTATNGYFVATESVDAPLGDGDDVLTFGMRHMVSSNVPNVGGEVAVYTPYNVELATALTVTLPSLGLSGSYPVHSIQTEFFPNTTGYRRHVIGFGAILANTGGPMRRRSAMRLVRTRIEGTRTPWTVPGPVVT